MAGTLPDPEPRFQGVAAHEEWLSHRGVGVLKLHRFSRESGRPTSKQTNKQTNKQSEGETYHGEFLGLLASLSLLGSLFVVGFKVLVRGMVIQPLIFEPLSIGV